LTGKSLDGRLVGQKVKERVRQELSTLRGAGIDPSLAIILVGDNPASKAYVRNIHSACTDVGMKSHDMELGKDTSGNELEQVIDRLNHDSAVTGILLQLPLPKGLDDAAAIVKISPEKDVDGLHPFNLGQLWRKSAPLVPCTPKGVIVLLKYYGIELAGKHVVIINRTKVVGRPLAQLLLNEDATVTVCHSKTQGLRDIARQADILITGIGRRQDFTVGVRMIKPDAVVVDIGTSTVGGRLLGDVDFEPVSKVAAFITPVPGGVGPMTIAMLLYNVLVAASIQRGVPLSFNPEELSSAELP
jgi:methylenetetrahydrofolate dehydrogenase (NADP+)/methenyltetrahydrofolate cyclohydrolase